MPPSKPTGHLAYCIAAKAIRCSSFQKKVLLLYYAIRADEHGRFFDSNFNISAETGVSDSTITRTNQEWQRAKLLTVTEPEFGSGKANEYQLHLDALQRVASTAHADVEAQRLKAISLAQHRERQQRYRDSHKAKNDPIGKLRRAIGKS
jgi:hypothetical protein